MTTAVPIPKLLPGDPDWLKVMSASKVSAMLGLSPWESRYSLWQRMAGRIDPQPDDAQKRRGHYLEPVIAKWWHDQRPELGLRTTGSWHHKDRPWQVVTPDRLVVRTPRARKPVALLEVKTAANDWEWGTPGTDEIPVYYQCQAQWALDVFGLDVCHVAVLTSYLEFREYVVHYDAEDAAYLRKQALEFLASLEAGDAPDIDDHDQTYEAVRQLHPDIDGTDHQLDPQLAADYAAAVTQYGAAARAKKHASARVIDAMGNARRAMCGDDHYATRQARGEGTPFLVASRGLTQERR
ncbi:YqaJ viral recombinase family protein [Segeticoccus rhizosphaerae]|uniref:YqaJ viral recombinase family nuclease n=1 Tax=Segeticoccus rhizosphaerae TaxID=1104777 RepID=UPI001396767F|nr:YqaJ viral recombinase family protein [Segeticoccus rhizosphaerae]